MGRRKACDVVRLEFVPASHWRTRAQFIGAVVIALCNDTPRTLADLARVVEMAEDELADRCGDLAGHVEALRLDCGDVAFAHSHGVVTSSAAIDAMRVATVHEEQRRAA